MSEEWNRPSRTDYYLMQLTAAMAASKIDKLEELKITFTDPNSKATFQKRITPALIEQSKFGWLSSMTGELEIRQRG